MDKTPEILLIISCSKGKLPTPAEARRFYTGQLFRKLVNLARNLRWDVRILSGKYGLISLSTIVHPYDQKIETPADIKRIRRQALPALKTLIPEYTKIVIFMGKTYRKVLKPLVTSPEHCNKFVVIHSTKGIFGYNKLLSQCSKLPKAQVLSHLQKFDGYYSKQQQKNQKNKDITLTNFMKEIE